VNTSGGALPSETDAQRPVIGDVVPPLVVQVGLDTGLRAVRLACDGPAYVLGTDRRRQGRFPAPTLVCERAAGSVRWRTADGAGGTASSVVLQPVDPERTIRCGDLSVRGEVAVLPDRHGRGLTVVNAVELESYLRGVVPFEIGRPGPEARAALAAQAVAARTYTISHLGARQELGFDLFASVSDQVYRGAGHEDPDCDAAIVATAGLVLRHAGREIEAYYHAACGGMTSQVEAVWPRPARPYLVAHADRPSADEAAYCAQARYFRWEAVWSRPALEEILAASLPAYVEYMTRPDRAPWADPTFTPATAGADPAHPGRLHGLEIVARTPSGRVGCLDLRCDAGVYHVRGDRVRWVLVPAGGDPPILRSAWFDLTLERGEDGLRRIEARGRGYGHGVGLCQSGALAMARAGRTYQEILAHYYPTAALEPVADAERSR
jgi:stage II sporulation protein D